MKRVNEELLDYVDGFKRLDDEPYTGVGYFVDDEGRLEAEITYQDGVQTGPRRAWYDTGKLYREYSMFRGVNHGKRREWHRNGQLAEEADYEIGFKLRAKRWDEDGNLIEDYELPKDDPDYKRLVDVYRPSYPDAPPLENPID